MIARSVVIVEDDPDTAEMLAEMMRVLGYQVHKCSGGLRAVDLIAEKRPTTVLLDQMMPEISGLEVLATLRLDARLRHIPVIMVSAKSLPSDIRYGLEAGAVSYLTKPVSFADLKKAIDQVNSPDGSADH